MMRGCSAVRAASPSWLTSANSRRAATRGIRGARAAPRTPDGHDPFHRRSLYPSRHSRGAYVPHVQVPCSYSSTSQASPKPVAVVNPSDTLSERFRSAMRLLTHPVVVLAAHDGTHPRAMTMSSLTSLALTPTPLVTFNVATPSRTLEALARGESQYFNIHILTGDEHGANVAAKFARGNADGLFDGVHHEQAEDAPPVLLGRGVLHVLKCRLAKSEAPEDGMLRVRDHVIVVAEVVDMMPGQGENFGLSYADREHRKVGERIGVVR